MHFLEWLWVYCDGLRFMPLVVFVVVFVVCFCVLSAKDELNVNIDTCIIVHWLVGLVSFVIDCVLILEHTVGCLELWDSMTRISQNLHRYKPYQYFMFPLIIRKASVWKLPFEAFVCVVAIPLSLIVSWCFEPHQPQMSGMNTNFTLSPSYSFHKSLYHKSCCCCFLAYLYSAGNRYSTREPASSRVTYFTLRAYTGTGVSHSQHRKKSREVWKKCRWMDRKGSNE